MQLSFFFFKNNGW